MSSYQFVNSLAACYSGQRSGNGEHGHGSGGGTDYYNNTNPIVGPPGGTGGVGVNYPSCYSPQIPAGAPGQQSSGNYYGASPQHHVANLSNGGPSASDYRQMSSGPSGPSLLSLGNPMATAVSNNNNVPACKYENKYDPLSAVSSLPCGSPQDLTTNSNGSSSASSVCSTPRSPPLHSGGQRSSHSQNPQSNASSNNSTSPNSTSGSQTQQSGNPTKGSSANPPHIYPWMKRVHLGTSKRKEQYFKIFYFYINNIQNFILKEMNSIKKLKIYESSEYVD